MAELTPAQLARRSSRRRLARRIAAGLALGLIVAGWISTDGLMAFGGSPSDATVERMRASPRFVSDHFENAEPTGVMKGGTAAATWAWFTGPEMRAPICPLPLVTDTAARIAAPPPSGLRVTWLGHSTTLIEIDGNTVLTDPMWSQRASPSTWVGPQRFHPPPLPFVDLPHVDAVVISHEHYDHLDMATIRALAARGPTFHVALGVGAHLEAWGVPAAQIVEQDWWEAATLPGGLSVISTPARHFSGRGVPMRVGASWTSWSLVGPKHRVFFSGDTGLTEAFREIAARNGPFDLALLEIGQYDPSWGDIHLGPVGALDAHAMLGAKRLFPIHWATFQLGMHAWSEPAETLTALAGKRGVSLVTPQLGEPVEPTLGAASTPWWRAFPPIAAQCP